MKSRFSKYCLAALLVTVIAGAGCSKQINWIKSRDALNKGVTAFKAANYSDAATYFDTAIELDDSFTTALAYRAYSYMMQYVPGADSPDNLAVAQRALDGFQEVLDREPDNDLAISSIASLYFHMGELEKAKDWNIKRIANSPDAKEAYYTIGVINWTKTYEPRMEARAEAGMEPEDPGPIKDEETRTALAETSLPLVDEGLENLKKSVEIDPDYADAMAYINLMYREKADLVDDEAQYEELIAQANEWVDRTIETKKRLAEAEMQATIAEQTE